MSDLEVIRFTFELISPAKPVGELVRLAAPPARSRAVVIFSRL